MEAIVVKKSFELKGGNVEGNTLHGVAAVMGNIDRSGDVIFPGAFKAALPQFLKEGFVPIGHDWYDFSKVAAYPTFAKEQGAELVVTADFHSVQAAQDMKQIIVERIEAGKSVGLSVGFSVAPDGWIWFSNGEALLTDVKERGFDVNLFDVKSLKKIVEPIRAIVSVQELYEFSIVAVPMNPKAQISAVKDFRNDNSRAGLSFCEHLDFALAAVEEVVIRSENYKSMKESDGRSMSDERVLQLQKLQERISKLIEGAPKPNRNGLAARRLALSTLGSHLTVHGRS